MGYNKLVHLQFEFETEERELIGTRKNMKSKELTGLGHTDQSLAQDYIKHTPTAKAKLRICSVEAL
jgi:hypothetical protein